MVIKQREGREILHRHREEETKAKSAFVESVADLNKVPETIHTATVKGRDGTEKHFFRHSNPKKFGPVTAGWVSSTGFAGPKVFMDKTAVVDEEASVTGEAELRNHARVYGNAIVKCDKGSKIVINNSEIFDEVTVSASQNHIVLIKDSTVSGNHTYHNVNMDGDTKTDRA